MSLTSHRCLPVACALLIGLAAGVEGADPFGTAFTYQGQLAEGGGPASGQYDLQFQLYDAPVQGNRKGPILASPNTLVREGTFTVQLDFGPGAFNGEARWLEIAARTNGGTRFVTLSPRQTMTASPYALVAASAMGVAATNIVGVLPEGHLPATLPWLDRDQTFSGALRITNTGSRFAGDGSGLTNVNAARLDGREVSAFAPANHTHPVSDLGGGALPDTRLSSNVVLLDPTTGRLPDGKLPTNIAWLDATSGKLPNAHLPDNIVLLDPTTGRLPDGKLPTNIAWLDAASGKLPNAHLPDNIALLDPATGRLPDGKLPTNAALLDAASGKLPNVHLPDNIALLDPATGRLPDGKLPTNVALLSVQQTFNSIKHFAPPSGPPFSVGSSEKVPGLNADSLDGLDSTALALSNQVWHLSGNAGTSPRTDFVGTRDNQALELRVNNDRALRLEPGPSSPNVIAGSQGNAVETGVAGAAVGGGGTVAAPHAVAANFGVIAGGSGHAIQAGSTNATIAGGANNLVSANAPGATIPGGMQARADSFGQMAYASGAFASAGDAQSSVYVLRGTSSGTAFGELFLDGSTRRMTIPTNSTWAVHGLVAARSTGGEAAGYRFWGVIENQNGTARLLPRLGGNTNYSDTLGADDPNWGFLFYGTNSAFVIRAHGSTGDTVRWVATVYTTEVKH